MILVRSDSSGAVFLVREGEEPAAFESLRKSYPGSPIQLLKRGAGLLLVRVAFDGAKPLSSEFAIGGVEIRRARGSASS